MTVLIEKAEKLSEEGIRKVCEEDVRFNLSEKSLKYEKDKKIILHYREKDVKEFIKRLKGKKGLNPKFIYLSVRELDELAGDELI